MTRTHTLLKQVEQLEFVVLLVTIFFLPLFILPIFPNVIVTAKLALLVFSAFSLLIFKSVRMVLTGKLSFSTSLLDFPILLLGISYVLSTLFASANKMEALSLPGTTTIIVMGCLFYFFVSQLRDTQRKLVTQTLLASLTIGSVIVLGASVGLFKSFTTAPAYLKDISFSTFGGTLAAIVVLLVAVIFSLRFVIYEKDLVQKTLYGICLGLCSLSLIASIVLSLPGKQTTPQLPTFGTSWEVATETIKVSPLFGAGPGNYLTAFNRFRPLSYNASTLWNTRFINASNFYLTVLTEVGLLGFVALVLLLLTLFRSVRAGLSFELVTTLFIAILFLFMPITPVSFFIFCIVAALAYKTTSVSFTLLSHAEGRGEIPLSGRIPSIVAALPVLIVSAIVMYQSFSIIRAEFLYGNALARAAANDGRGAYDGLRSTIVANPYVDRYRISYAQVNIALANAIASNQNLSDQDKNTISQLVQQAIREGKAAVALNPGRASNWELLASIYRSIIPLAQGADEFAVQTYAQAVALDPFNPQTRLALGGLFYSAKNYDEAINQFRLAVQSKPDFANANYNLALAYREKGDSKNAQAFFDRTLSLVTRDSEDYKKVQQDLDNIKKNASVKPETATVSGELQAPETLTTPENPAITLPSEATPPATPAE